MAKTSGLGRRNQFSGMSCNLPRDVREHILLRQLTVDWMGGRVKVKVQLGVFWEMEGNDVFAPYK
jgi:hypothetical protein